MTRLVDNVFLLATLSLSMCAWVIAFVGACIIRQGLTGGAWWIIVYELLLIVVTLIIFITNTYIHYRYMILTFLAASISMLTYQIDFALPLSKFLGGYRSGAGAYAAGYIILIIIQFLWVIMFGKETEDGSKRYPPTVPQQQYEMAGNKMTGSLQHRVTSPTHPATTVDPARMSSDIVQPATEYNERVQALHAYKASPEDPNELSFSKGEFLEIVDRTGNWWQARKADGTVGIIPSNYFGPPKP
ncbi:hypothetical protein EDC96DRAFT_507121 [Choanephora cucurbitarum]|nr:hypothetical protein EDC96DRAFT_507121 [Choanephora cucurbitarum]